MARRLYAQAFKMVDMRVYNDKTKPLVGISVAQSGRGQSVMGFQQTLRYWTREDLSRDSVLLLTSLLTSRKQ